MKPAACMSLLIALLTPSALNAKPDCPPQEQGVVPWEIREIMPGDRWAWVYLKIDTHGRPYSCGIGENNMTPGLRSRTCISFIRNWKAVPVMRDGKPVATTIKRHFIAIGDKHYEANREARKRFFLEHPDERPECYRE